MDGSKSRHETAFSCLAAVFVHMKCKEVWQWYVKDFFATKLGLGSQSSAERVERYLISHADDSVQERVANLHVCVRLNHLDSQSLSLMRILDDLQKQYHTIPEEHCHISSLEDSSALFEIVIKAMYNVLIVMSTSVSPNHVDGLKKLSSIYLQIVSSYSIVTYSEPLLVQFYSVQMRLPTIRSTIVRTCVQNDVKLKWDIVHTSLLMLNCEDGSESLESTVDSILQCFLYLHQKFLSKDEESKVTIYDSV